MFGAWLRALILVAPLAAPGCVEAASGGGGVEGVTSVDDEAGMDANYPLGPYGKQVGEVFPRMTFLDEEGAVVDLADDYLSNMPVRIIFGTTSWCSPCIPDAEYLFTQMQEKHPVSGAFGILLEDLYGDQAQPKDARAYNGELESFEFLADPGRALEGVFTVASAYPRVAVLATDTMQIVYIATGHDMDAVLAGVTSAE